MVKNENQAEDDDIVEVVDIKKIIDMPAPSVNADSDSDCLVIDIDEEKPKKKENVSRPAKRKRKSTSKSEDEKVTPPVSVRPWQIFVDFIDSVISGWSLLSFMFGQKFLMFSRFCLFYKGLCV